MKKIVLAVVMVMLAVCVVNAEEAWQELGVSDTGDRYYIDVAGVNYVSRDRAYGWVKMVYSKRGAKSLPHKNITEVMTRYMASCEYTGMTAIEIHAFRGRKLVKSYPKLNANVSLVPGSVSKDIYDAMCKMVDTHNDAVDRQTAILTGKIPPPASEEPPTEKIKSAEDEV